MSWRTHPVVIALRFVIRRSGIKRLLGTLPRSNRYEDRFQEEMFASVRAGDCVWDVGANVGLYSQSFAELTGGHGRVICFEPSEANLAVLRKNVDDRPNVTVVSLALGREDETVLLQQGDDPFGATSKILQGAADPGTDTTPVKLARGDRLVEEGLLPAPNVLKVDTEGFELDVLRGLESCLKSPTLRTVCVEVHFGLLAERGMALAPAEIELLLTTSGFTCRWTDPSHIVCHRNSS